MKKEKTQEELLIENKRLLEENSLYREESLSAKLFREANEVILYDSIKSNKFLDFYKNNPISIDDAWEEDYSQSEVEIYSKSSSEIKKILLSIKTKDCQEDFLLAVNTFMKETCHLEDYISKNADDNKSLVEYDEFLFDEDTNFKNRLIDYSKEKYKNISYRKELYAEIFRKDGLTVFIMVNFLFILIMFVYLTPFLTTSEGDMRILEYFFLPLSSLLFFITNGVFIALSLLHYRLKRSKYLKTYKDMTGKLLE